jgi:CheY-like chemotaxis protein
MPDTGELRILVVEDEGGARTALASLLAGFGFRCDVAATGEAALRAHRGQAYDVILSDWTMPGINGLDLCRAIRTLDGEQRHTRFILMTAHGESYLLERLRRVADAVLPKPVSVEQTLALLATSASRPTAGQSPMPPNGGSGARRSVALR